MMKHTWFFLPLVLAFALITSMAGALAPTISPLPDIFIGDAEDNVGTIDNNLFRFSDAFDLDNYVADADTTVNLLMWSFVVDPANTGDLEINGKLDLDILTEDPRTPGSKDIRAPHGDGTFGLVSLRDLLDSPRPDNLPYGAPAPGLNEIVTFWVADDSGAADSDDVIVAIVDEGTDHISAQFTGTPTPEPVVSYDFETTNDGWTFSAPNASTYDSQYTGATSTYDTHKLGVTCGTTTNTFGFWSSPTIAGDAGKLFKYAWQVNTTQANTLLVPVIRFRVNETTFASDVTMAVTSSNGALSPPTSGVKTYNEFFMPTADTFASFDVYCFDRAEFGTVSLEQLDVTKINPADLTGWTPVTVPALSSWTLTNGIGVYNNLAVASNAGGVLTLGSTGTTEDRGYAFWTSADIAWTTGKLLRGTFTLSSSTSPNTITGAVNAGSSDFNWRLRLTYNAAKVPGTGPTDYPIYFDTQSGTNCYLSWEGFDFLPALNGTNTLSAVTLEQNDVIP